MNFVYQCSCRNQIDDKGTSSELNGAFDFAEQNKRLSNRCWSRRANPCRLRDSLMYLKLESIEKNEFAIILLE